jgi:hypothetical protein
MARRNAVNTEQIIIEEEINKGFKSKFSTESSLLSNEHLIDKKGIIGKVKLGIKSLGGKTLESVEKVYLKYTDITKRKFV